MAGKIEKNWADQQGEKKEEKKERKKKKGKKIRSDSG